MQPPPASENSIHPVPGSLPPAVPTRKVLRRRTKEYLVAWWLFFMWVVLAVIGLVVIAELLFGGWTSLSKFFAIAHSPFEEPLFLLLIACGAGIYISAIQCG